MEIIAQTTIQDMKYQLKTFKEYDRIKYLTKDTLRIYKDEKKNRQNDKRLQLKIS